MNTYIFIIGLCDLVIGFAGLKKRGTKRNFLGYSCIILGIFMVIASLTMFSHEN